MLRRLFSFIRSWLAPKARTSKRSRSSLEPLENRIAPATFINPHVVTYTDFDGDHVTVNSSIPIFKSTNFDSVLTFTSGTTAGTQILQEINLASSSITTNVAGDNLSVTVQKVVGGDGFANVGAIESSLGLGHVVVQGNLGLITAGNNLPEPGNYVGLSSLAVHSLGFLANAPKGPSNSLQSSIFGAVGSITVQTNIADNQFDVASNTTGLVDNGTIGSLVVGGSLVGGSDDDGGFIQTDGSVGVISIGGNLQGGAGLESGALQIGGAIHSLTVNNIVGYTIAGDTTAQGTLSASVMTGTHAASVGGIGLLTIKGYLIGGDGAESAQIKNTSTIGGAFGATRIGGSITGGSGDDSAEITGLSFNSISIGHGITGGSGLDSGSINSQQGIASIIISGGGIVGGTNTDAGSVIATGNIGAALIHGDVTGSASAGSTIGGTGQVQVGSIGTFTLYGSLGSATADVAQLSGSLIATGSIGAVAIHQSGASTGSLLGGPGSSSGEITAGSIGSVSIAGEIAGIGPASGAIISTGNIGSIAVLGGSLLGGTGVGSGEITAASVHSISIAGQILGSAMNSGMISLTGSLGSLTVGLGIVGGTGSDSGFVNVASSDGFGHNLMALNVTGGITGGMGADSGQVTVGGGIAAINLHGGALQGGAGPGSGVITATDSIGPVSAGTILTGSGAGSGQLSTGGYLASLALTNATGSNAMSGEVSVAGFAGAISVHGDIAGAGDSTGLFLIGAGVNSFSLSGALRGGSGTDSGAIFAGLNGTSGITHISVGDILGGSGAGSGGIVSYGTLGTVAVTGSTPGVTTHGIIGGSGPDSGQVYSGSTIASVVVHGALQGGSGSGSGAIVSSSVFNPVGDIQGNIGSVSITGSIVGATGPNSGQVSAAGNLNIVSVGGSVTGNIAGGSGAILAGADPTSVTSGTISLLRIAGALQGANIPDNTGAVNGSGYIEAGHISSAVIGSIQAGTIGANDTVTADGAILSANDIASLAVTGAAGIAGTSSNPVVISAYGQAVPGKTDLAFGRISVAHDVTYANFLAGYDQSLNPLNGAASIGAVIVGGNWSGSNLIAGAQPANFGGPFGSSVLINSSLISSIASIIIEGHDSAASQHGVINAPVPASPGTYGFIAGKIGAFTLDGAHQSLSFGEIDPVGLSTDTILRELA